MVAVKRALLSCHDKTGLDAFAAGLAGLGVELIASKGTATFLQQHGLRVKTLEEFASISEQLDGRVKTLHPKIHAGILAKRDDPAHVQAVGTAGLIDLVAVNLYPFDQTSRKPGVSLGEVLEQVDIGGVALLRASAKNFPSVAVVAYPAQYERVLEELKRHNGSLSEPCRRDLAIAAFALTSSYDRMITAYLTQPAPEADLPSLVMAQATPMPSLRYGENPHQLGGWYVTAGQPCEGLATLKQLGGKPLSYNNLLDVDTAVRCVAEFTRPACVIIKHASPCGIATAETLLEAYTRAYEADPESAFGGIVGMNRPLDAKTAKQMSAAFLEVIVAPSIPTDAKGAFASKPNIRLLELPPQARRPSETLEWRSLLGGWLIQQPDTVTLDPKAVRVVTTRPPTDAQRQDLEFAWSAAKHVKSNAIVVAKDQMTVGIGQGQPSRVRAVRLAIHNAGARSHGAVLASDGFFPFPDSIELAAQAGIAAVIQPGGSMRDTEVIEAANRAGLAMIVTGVRHFRH